MGNRKFNYTLYIVAGVYMLYIAFTTSRSLLTGENNKNVVFFAFAAVFFVVAGVVVIMMGIRGFKKVKQREQEEAQKEEEEEAARKAAEPQAVQEQEPVLDGRKLTIAERARLASRGTPVSEAADEAEEAGISPQSEADVKADGPEDKE